MFIDIDCTQQKKYNQNTYGDYFLSKRYPNEGRLVAVLSDGLGSGVKANILATMTATMLLKFIETESNIRKSCETIMNSLPVCQVRKISYSTFSAIDCTEEGSVKVVEEGNPQFLWIRGGEVLEPAYTEINSKTFTSRHMHVYNFQAALGDRLIFCSDGVTQAALGSPEYRLGLRREGLIDMVLRYLKDRPEVSSRELSRFVVRQAEFIEPDRKPKDDVSCCAFYFRMPRESLVFTGPPYHQDRDHEYAQLFKEFPGKKALCGGTTANLISRELHMELKPNITPNRGNLPGVSEMDGVNLVTEGILTLTRAQEYLEQGFDQIPEDAAGDLVRFFLDSDCINFMVGARLNQAHYDPRLPVEIEIRKNVIKKMEEVLKNKYIKKVNVQFM